MNITANDFARHLSLEDGNDEVTLKFGFMTVARVYADHVEDGKLKWTVEVVSFKHKVENFNSKNEAMAYLLAWFE